MTLIEAVGVGKTWGTGRSAQRALIDVAFRVQAGEVVGIIGPNGAGKTTLLRLIAGETRATDGELTVAGHRAGTTGARRAVGFAPDPPLAPPELTGSEWLQYLASHRAAGPEDRLRRIGWAVEVADLAAFVDRRIATYSRGMAQRLALASAALAGEAVLVLDEILSGADPLVQRHLRAEISQLAGASRAVLVASHDLATVERIATRVLVLVHGRIAADVVTSSLLRERVAELTLASSSIAGAPRLLRRFAGAERTGHGVSIPLSEGLSVERVLAACRDERLAVTESRVRYRALEDVLVHASVDRSTRDEAWTS